jgi:hypothetical protein
MGKDVVKDDVFLIREQLESMKLHAKGSKEVEKTADKEDHFDEDKIVKKTDDVIKNQSMDRKLNG